MTVEERLTLLEREFAQFKQTIAPVKYNWIDNVRGTFKDDPDFGEILQLGRAIRDAEPPAEGDGDA